MASGVCIELLTERRSWRPWTSECSILLRRHARPCLFCTACALPTGSGGPAQQIYVPPRYKGANVQPVPAEGVKSMSLGLILVIILVIFLLGGFSGRFGGYGYGYGHGGVGVLGTILIIIVILMLLGRI